jgi:hypothetical protein
MKELTLEELKTQNTQLTGALRYLCDMVAPTIKSETRLSQGLSSALIQARKLLEETE